MITRRHNSAGVISRGRRGNELGVSLQVAPRNVLISGPVDSQGTTDDVTYDIFTPAVEDVEGDVLVSAATPLGDLTFTSLDPSIATVDQLGRVDRISDGTARILIHSRRHNQRWLKPVTVVRNSGGASTDFVEFVAGSLARAEADAIDPAIAPGNGDVATLMPMYTNLAARTRNPGCWAAQLADLSCVDAEHPTSCLVGQQYGIQVEHYPNGQDVFVAMDGEVQTRSVIDFRNIGPANSSDGYASDIRVVKYSTPLPAKFVPALFPPANIEDYFGSLLGDSRHRCPVLCSDQEKKALVADLFSLDTRAVMKVPVDSRRLQFHESKISGDSGSNAFLVLPKPTEWLPGGAPLNIRITCPPGFGVPAVDAMWDPDNERWKWVASIDGVLYVVFKDYYGTNQILGFQLFDGPVEHRRWFTTDGNLPATITGTMTNPPFEPIGDGVNWTSDGVTAVPAPDATKSHRLCVLTGWTFGGAGSGSDWNDWATEINAAMTAMGGEEQLLIADLSGFHTYA